MVDVLTAEQRQLNMSRIRGRDTKPEMLIRRGLHARGLRFRLHARDLPGRPDLVFARYRSVVLVHGCFWHGHNCPMFKLPTTREDFWKEKIERNRVRDARNHAALRALGWRVLTVWECSLKGPAKKSYSGVLDTCSGFLQGDMAEMSIAGNWASPSVSE
jgi:DNA mismatch endonuclease (patch repair protein)